MESLNKVMKKEVAEIFQNQENMEFIKQMRQFKKKWDNEKSLIKRKSTAASMAEATKKWVST